MDKIKKRSLSEDEALRLRAEDRLLAQQVQQPQTRNAEDTQRLVHELEVHQIELEMQNAELSQSRDEVESALEKYTDLYDFSPAGYFTLDRNGVIRATNLTGSSFLAIDRANLIGKSFALFVATDSRPAFSRFLSQLFTTPGKTSCELTLTKNGDSPIIVQLAALAAESGQECRVAVIDITRRKQAEEALLVSESIYRAIGESIDYGIWICAPDGRNIYASQSFLDLVGMSQEQCSNFGWGDVLHPDDAEQTIAAWKECVRTGGTWDIEHRYRGVDGQWHDILARGLPVRNEQGEIIYWSGINLDISQLKKTEQSLRQSEERLRLFIEYAPAALAMFDNEMRYLYASNRWLSDYGLTGSYLCGLSHYEVLPEIPEEWREINRRALSGEVISKEEDLLVRADGSEQWLRWEVRPWFIQAGTPGGIVIFTEDITARKLAETALRESEERFRAIASASSDWIWEVDVNGRFTYASDNVLNALGYQAAELIGRTPFDLMPPGDAERIREEFQAIADKHDSFRDLPNINLHKNGEIRHVLTSGLPIFDRDGKLSGYRGVDRDITKRKLAEEKLLQSEKRLALAASATRIGIFDWNLTSNTILWTHTHEAIFGYAPDATTTTTTTTTTEEHDYRRWADRVYPEDLPLVEEESRRCMQDHLPLEVQYRIIWPDGSLHWVETKGIFLYDSDGKPCRLLGVVMDITERKSIEQEMESRETVIRMAARKLQTIMDTAPSAICVAYDRECRHITGNAQAHAMLGVPTRENMSATPGSCQTVPYRIFRDGNEVAGHELPMQRAASHGTVTYEEEIQILRQDGSQITILMSAAPLFADNGTITGSIGTFLDITKRKQIETALQMAHDELEQRVRERTADLESAVEVLQIEIAERKKTEHELERTAHEIEDLYNLAPCGYHSLNKDGMIVRINDTELNWLGYDRNEIVERMKVTDLMTPESLAVFADKFPSFMQGADIGDQRFNFVRKDGSILPVLLKATPILDENGDYIMSRSTIYDITELAQAEENIRRLNRLYLTLSETGKAIARFPGRTELFQQICRIAVKQGGFRMVWIGLVDEESKLVQPVASFGYGTDYLENIRISARPDDEGMGPTGSVIRSGGHYICNDFMKDPRTAPWRSEAEQRGFLSSAAFALSLNGRVVGAITIYAAEINYFDAQIVELLQQMQSDISFALDNLEREARRREAESALQLETTERLKIMVELRKKEQMLLQQSRLAAMGEMINNIAHQWRQPLNTLGLLVQKLPLIYDSVGIDRDYLEENTAKSMRLIQHMSQTINDFRDFFRSDKEIVTFSLDTVVRQAVAFIDQTFSDLKIKIDLDTEENVKVRGYPNEFAQALLNILMNARDALVWNNTADARIVLRTFEDNGWSVVTVTDNAGGIPEKIIDRVFDPYFTTKGPDKGTGLGLFMSKTIIEKNMTGRLTVRNNGNGAEFRIEVAYGDT